MLEKYTLNGWITFINCAECSDIRFQEFDRKPLDKQFVSLKSLNSNPQKIAMELAMLQPFFIAGNVEFAGDFAGIRVQDCDRPF